MRSAVGEKLVPVAAVSLIDSGSSSFIENLFPRKKREERRRKNETSFNGPCSMIIILHLKIAARGSGGDSVGRAVSSNTRDPWFEVQSSAILFTYHQLCGTDGNKEKRLGMAHFQKEIVPTYRK